MLIVVSLFAKRALLTFVALAGTLLLAEGLMAAADWHRPRPPLYPRR